MPAQWDYGPWGITGAYGSRSKNNITTRNIWESFDQRFNDQNNKLSTTPVSFTHMVNPDSGAEYVEAQGVINSTYCLSVSDSSEQLHCAYHQGAPLFDADLQYQPSVSAGVVPPYKRMNFNNRNDLLDPVVYHSGSDADNTGVIIANFRRPLVGSDTLASADDPDFAWKIDADLRERNIPCSWAVGPVQAPISPSAISQFTDDYHDLVQRARHGAPDYNELCTEAACEDSIGPAVLGSAYRDSASFGGAGFCETTISALVTEAPTAQPTIAPTTGTPSSGTCPISHARCVALG